MESLDWLRVPLRFWLLAASPRRLGVTLGRELPRLRRELDAGRLAPVGLVRETGANPLRLTRNHQVLAYAHEAAGSRLVVRLYDPNWPDRDDVTIVVDGAGEPGAATLHQSTGEPLAAFFVAPYARGPVRAWR